MDGLSGTSTVFVAGRFLVLEGAGDELGQVRDAEHRRRVEGDLRSGRFRGRRGRRRADPPLVPFGGVTRRGLPSLAQRRHDRHQHCPCGERDSIRSVNLFWFILFFLFFVFCLCLFYLYIIIIFLGGGSFSHAILWKIYEKIYMMIYVYAFFYVYVCIHCMNVCTYTYICMSECRRSYVYMPTLQ